MILYTRLFTTQQTNLLNNLNNIVKKAAAMVITIAAAFSFPAAVVDTADVVAATVVTFSEVPPVSVFPHDTIADIIVSIARQVTIFFIINSPLFFVQRSNLSLLTMSL